MKNINPFYNKKFDYVRTFELDDKILPLCYIVCRIDGKNFHKFSHLHKFLKPNDLSAIYLMNNSAFQVMKNIKDILFSYGQSDEFSFVFAKNTDYVSRRTSKIVSHVVSLFTAAYTAFYNQYFPHTSLQILPSFDGRCIVYPNETVLKDYIKWRQVDCHVNNLYNTTFWTLIAKDGKSSKNAQIELEGTFSGDKNEILFQHGINYNDEPQIFRKGTFLVRQNLLAPKFLKSHIICSASNSNFGSGKGKSYEFYKLNPIEIFNNIILDDQNNSNHYGIHIDLISEDFWDQNPALLLKLE